MKGCPYCSTDKGEMHHLPEAQRLRSQGYSYGKIGILLGISRQRVHQILVGYRNDYRPKILEEILARDHSVCQLCGASDNVIVHHINGNTLENRYENLITLCEVCHRNQHPQQRGNPYDPKSAPRLAKDYTLCNKCKVAKRLPYGQLCRACANKRCREYQRRRH